MPLILAASLGGGVYWSSKNYQRLVYLIKKDRYASLELELAGIHSQLEGWSKNKENYPQGRIDIFADLMEDIISNHPEDAYIHYMKSSFYTKLLESKWEKNRLLLSDLILLSHVGQLQAMSRLNPQAVDMGVRASRKGLAIGLPEKEARQMRENLMKLYLLHGVYYWDAAFNLGREDLSETPIYQIYAILLRQRKPDWNILLDLYGEEAIQTWKAIYFIDQGDTPQAFRILNNLLSSESLYVQNNARYLLGRLHGGVKNRKLKLRYYRQIELSEFGARNPWFIEEMHTLLVETGNTVDARKLLVSQESIQSNSQESDNKEASYEAR